MTLCSWSDLTDRHAADKVLADKVLVVTSSERENRHYLDSDESQDQDRHEHEIVEEDNEEKGYFRQRGAFLLNGALGSLISGAASVAKAVNDSKTARCKLEELQRHNRAMEQSRGLYLAPHKYGRVLYLGPYKRG